MVQSTSKKKQLNTSPPENKRKPLWQRILVFSAWFIFKWVFIIACLVTSVVFGLIIGYSVVGDGDAGEVLDVDMWRHIYDLVFTTNG